MAVAPQGTVRGDIHDTFQTEWWCVSHADLTRKEFHCSPHLPRGRHLRIVLRPALRCPRGTDGEVEARGAAEGTTARAYHSKETGDHLLCYISTVQHSGLLYRAVLHHCTCTVQNRSAASHACTKRCVAQATAGSNYLCTRVSLVPSSVLLESTEEAAK